MRLLYSIAVEIVVWLVLVPIELGRIALGRSSRGILAERLGSFEGRSITTTRRLLIHAVSAGEMNAASAIVHELAHRDWTFIISAGNEDAHRTALRIQQQHREVERVVAWPWDRRGAVARWLDAVRPDAVVVIETEIWPNLFAACRDCSIPLVVAGARIEAAAARWYRLLRGFFAPVLDCADAILAVDARERERYLAIGVRPERVEIGGSLKAEACLIEHEAPATRSKMLVVGASTHPGEEKMLIEACRRAGPDVHLVLVPRHVSRAAGVRLLAAAAWPQGRVEVIGGMGELSAIYRRASVAVIGGTFVAVGGHDVFEPARAGCAIVVGPNVDHIREIVSAMEEAGAIRRTTSEDLAPTLANLLADEGARSRIAENARVFAASKTGTAAVCAKRIEQLTDLLR